MAGATTNDGADATGNDGSRGLWEAALVVPPNCLVNTVDCAL